MKYYLELQKRMRKTKKTRGGGLGDSLVTFFQSLLRLIFIIVETVCTLLGTILYFIYKGMGILFLGLAMFMTKMATIVEIPLIPFKELLRNVRGRISTKGKQLMSQVTQKVKSLKSQTVSTTSSHSVKADSQVELSQRNSLPVEDGMPFVDNGLLKIYFKQLNDQGRGYIPIIKGINGKYMHFGEKLGSMLPSSIEVNDKKYIKEYITNPKNFHFYYRKSIPIIGGGSGYHGFVPTLTFETPEIEKLYNESKLEIQLLLNHFIFTFLLPFAHNVYQSIDNVHIFKHVSCLTAERSKRSVVFRTPTFSGTVSSNSKNTFYQTIPQSNNGGHYRKRTIKMKRRGGEISFGTLKDKMSSARSAVTNELSSMKKKISTSMQRQNICMIKDGNDGVYRITRKRNYGLGDTKIVYACDQSKDGSCDKEAVVSCENDTVTIRNRSDPSDSFTFQSEGACEKYQTFKNNPYVPKPSTLSKLFASLYKNLSPEFQKELSTLFNETNIDFKKAVEKTTKNSSNETPESLINILKKNVESSPSENNFASSEPLSTANESASSEPLSYSEILSTKNNNLPDENKLVGGGDSVNFDDIKKIFQNCIPVIFKLIENLIQKSSQTGGGANNNGNGGIEISDLENVYEQSKQINQFLKSLHFFPQKTMDKMNEHFDRQLQKVKQIVYHVTQNDNNLIFYNKGDLSAPLFRIRIA